MTNIESIGIIDTVHQSLDFSSFSEIANIELEEVRLLMEA